MCINLDIFEAFLFADIDIVYLQISFFFIFLIQIVIVVIKTLVIFNSNLESNTDSFIYIVKQRHQALLGSESDNSNNKATRIKNQVSEHETEDDHIKTNISSLSSSKNKAIIIILLLYILSCLGSK